MSLASLVVFQQENKFIFPNSGFAIGIKQYLAQIQSVNQWTSLIEMEVQEMYGILRLKKNSIVQKKMLSIAIMLK